MEGRLVISFRRKTQDILKDITEIPEYSISRKPGVIALFKKPLLQQD